MTCNLLPTNLLLLPSVSMYMRAQSLSKLDLRVLPVRPGDGLDILPAVFGQ